MAARYRSPTASNFVEEGCHDLSVGGMFIKSSVPAAPGTLLKLECQVDHTKSDSKRDQIHAVARVVWSRTQDGENAPSGMGVKFVKLDDESRGVIESIVARSSPPDAPKSLASQTPANAVQQATPEATKPVEVAPEPPAPASATSAELPALPKELPPPTVVRESQAMVTAATLKPTQSASRNIGLWLAVAAAVIIAGAALRRLPACNSHDTASHHASDATSAAPQVEANAPIAPALVAPRVKALPVAPPFEPTPRDPVAPAAPTVVAAAANAAPAATEAVAAAPVEAVPAAAIAPVEAPSAATTDANYVLDITTSPKGAAVTMGAQRITGPGRFQLGSFESPVKVLAQLAGYSDTAAIVDRSGFVEKDGKMQRRVYLSLKRIRRTEDDVTSEE